MAANEHHRALQSDAPLQAGPAPLHSGLPPSCAATAALRAAPGEQLSEGLRRISASSALISPSSLSTLLLPVAPTAAPDSEATLHEGKDKGREQGRHAGAAQR